MTFQVTKNVVFKSFCDRYEGFLRKRINHLMRCGIPPDDAYQEMYLLVWEALSHKNCNFYDNTDAWIYQHITLRFARKLESYLKISSKETPIEIKHDIHGSSEEEIFGDGVSAERYYDTVAQVEAKSWLSKAIETAAKLPKAQRKTVVAWLKPAKLLEFSTNRTIEAVGILVDWEKEAKANAFFGMMVLSLGDFPASLYSSIQHMFLTPQPEGAWNGRTQGTNYEVASTADLRAFTGDDNAGKLLQEGLMTVVKRIGHPFENHQPDIRSLHPASFEYPMDTEMSSGQYTGTTEEEFYPLPEVAPIDEEAAEHLWEKYFQAF